MAYQNKPNTGALFIKKQRKSEKQPNFEGNFNLGGKDWDIAGWMKVTKTGDKYISLKIEEPQNKAKPQQAEPAVDDYSDMPF